MTANPDGRPDQRPTVRRLIRAVSMPIAIEVVLGVGYLLAGLVQAGARERVRA